MTFPWPIEQIMRAYDESRVFTIDSIMQRDSFPDTIRIERKRPRAAMENKTMTNADKQKKIREYLADIVRAQRGGKISDRVHTVNLHRGRGSSLKKLNRLIRTQLGLRPDTYVSAEANALVARRWEQIKALNAA